MSIRTLSRLALATALAVIPTALSAQRVPAQPASGSDPQFKVRLDFNRWPDVAELKSDFEKLQ